ncbi:alpha-hydroxy-acid oxidizing protein, partial [Staphylococcus aureus]
GVMIGRAPLFGLAIGGSDGASRVIEILASELRTTMGFLGATELHQLREVVADLREHDCRLFRLGGTPA